MTAKKEREQRIYREHAIIEVACSVCHEHKIDMIGIEAWGCPTIKLCGDCAGRVGELAEEEGID